MAMARAVFAAVGAIDAARAALTHGALVPLWRPLVSELAVVLTLHRFADRDRGVAGTPVDLLRANLEFLRRHQFPVAALGDLVSDPPGPRPTGPQVVFTVDDGYAEFATVAAPVFAEFDCPVTVFMTTGPVDNGTWYWWDRVDYAIGKTTRPGLSLELGGRRMHWQWRSPGDRDIALASVNEALKVVSDEEKERAIVLIADQLNVAIPSGPPPRFAAMSWDDVRRCAKMGVTFGPHSVTHPILPQVDAARSDWEMRESWRRLQVECSATVPVFCYPNGAYSDREVSLLAATDLKAAVTTFSRYAAVGAFQSPSPTARFAVPRFGY